MNGRRRIESKEGNVNERKTEQKTKRESKLKENIKQREKVSGRKSRTETKVRKVKERKIA